MMHKRLFSRDAFTGVTRYFHYDDDTDTAVIEAVQDIEPLLESNQSERNGYTSLDRWGDLARVASIPAHVYGQMLAEGWAHDEAKMKRWLNDPENRRYRTRAGKV